MGSPYVGEIRLFAGTFAPVNWQFCDGRQLPISGYEALYNLIGTTYGGDGIQTFALPNLASRVPVHQGTSSTGTYVMGQVAGTENVTITEQTMPIHTHSINVTSAGQTASPLNALPAITGGGPANSYVYGGGTAKPTTLLPATIGFAGGSLPHENLQPYLCATFIISLYGIYPSPS